MVNSEVHAEARVCQGIVLKAISTATSPYDCD